MKFIGALIVSSVVPMGFIALAAYMIQMHQRGCGWCMLCALLSWICVKINVGTEEDNE